MRKIKGFTILINLLLLLSLAAIASGDEVSYRMIDNMYTGDDGVYAFEGLPDGNYTLVAVNWSEKKMLWYTGIKNVTLKGADLSDVDMKINSTTDIDVDYIYGLVNNSSVTGMTYVMNTDHPRKSQVVLLDQQTKKLIADTESDDSGIYYFNDIPGGDYSIAAVNYSSEKELWYTGIINITLNGTSLENQDIKVSSSGNIDAGYILGLLNSSSVSGTVYITGNPVKTDVVLLDQQTDELIADTESDDSGYYYFSGIPDGDYSVVAVNYSADDGIWYGGINNITLKGTDLAGQDLILSTSSGVDENHIQGLLNRSSVSGMIYVMKPEYPRQSLVVLLQSAESSEYVELPSSEDTEQEDNSTDSSSDNDNSSGSNNSGTSSSTSAYEYYLSLTTDRLGDFIFDNIPDGEYRVSAVNWSTSMGGMWLTNVTDITVENGETLNLGNLSMRQNEDVDQDAILSMKNETYISGKTIGKKGDYKISDVVLTNQFGEYVADTTSNSEGDFVFQELHNGQYTVSAVNWSTAMDGMWLTNVTEVIVENGNPAEIGNLTLRLHEDVDQDAILSMRNETYISGKAIGKKGDCKISDVVLTNQFGEYVADTTSNSEGDFVFQGLHNGQYTVSAVNWSTAMDGMWLTNVTEVTVENGNPAEIGNLTLRLHEDVDQDAILSMRNETYISGKTIGKNGDSKISDVVLMKKRAVASSNQPHLNIAFVTGYSSYENELASLEERINSDSDLNIDFSYYVTTNLPDDIDLSNEDIIYIVMVTQSAEIVEDTVQDAIDNGAVVIGSNTYLPESSYTVPEEFADQAEFKDYLSNYWSGGASDESNFDNLVFYLAQEFYGRDDLTVEEPTGLESAIYHPAMTTTATPYFTGDTGEYFSWYANRTEGHAFNRNAPTVGITFYKSYYPDDMDPIDKLIEDFENKGVNVVACYGNADNYLDGYLNYSSDTKVEAVVSFHYRGNYFDIEALGVPVMNAVLNGYMNTSQWIESTTPLPETNMLRIYGPETEGLIDPIMIGAKETITVNNSTVEKYIGYDSQIEWLVDRTIAQANLSLENETDKKVAIIYYNHGGGKDNIGASYLEVTPSIVNLLEGMADDGYDVDSSLIPNNTELVNLMVYQGRNVGTWAPGELEALVETGEVELIPESTYLSWFNELPEERRNEVIETWGEPPGEIMVYTDDNGDKFIVIPKISISDNVILAPQPTRGWLQDNEVLYHDTELAPHHQYIAFYLWLQHEFDADVMVNMGRHGTVEWLPGKDFCLLSDEWPSIMVGDIPVIYPYVMDGTGEGIQAKRRGNAVIIDHLIPSVVSAGLYGNYSVLSSEINSYQTSLTEDDSLKEAHLQEIVNLTLELNLDEQVNVSLAENNETVDEFLDELSNILDDLKTQSMPYGLHILGEAPEGEALTGMVNTMLGDDFTDQVALYNSTDSASTDLLALVLLENMSYSDAQIKILGTEDENIDTQLDTAIEYSQLLGEADNEIEQVLSAMDGEYISSNIGGDPVLRPETLPSGSNFYAFDEQLIPTKEAWEEGKALVDEWLESYYEENGEYPTKVGYILWAGESTRHEGIMESQILYLMGIEPVWNEDNSEVEDVQVINSSELGRPRIDVIVQISGLYRDTFPMKVQLIDKAVRLAYAEAENDEYENYVSLNTDTLQAELNETVQDSNLSLDIAQFRIFGPADGAYGTGMANAVSSSDTWENNTELAELYISKMSFVYGQNIWGQTISEYIEMQTGQTIDINSTDLFESNLNGTQAIFHSRSSSTYGSLDTDDFYQYMGGLYNAITYVSGESPEAYVVNLQDLSDLEIQTLSTYLSNELYARYFNPSWISAMQLHGYEGAREMESFLENLWGWEALDPDLISDDVWNAVYDTYFADSELSDWLKENNPYAYQSMITRMTETVRKGSWDASDEMLQSLVAEQIRSVNENGATCCHHTCGNFLNQEFVEGIAQALVETGEISQDELDTYMEIMEEATTSSTTSTDTTKKSSSSSSGSGNTGDELKVVDKSSGVSNQTSSSDSGAGENLDTEASLKSSAQDSYVEGYEMTKENVEQNSSASGTSISGSDIIASILIIAGVGIIYFGFMRRNK